MGINNQFMGINWLLQMPVGFDNLFVAQEAINTLKNEVATTVATRTEWVKYMTTIQLTTSLSQ